MVQLRLLTLALLVGCSNSVITTAPAGSVDELGGIGGSGGEAAEETAPEASGGATETVVTSNVPAGGASTAASSRATTATAAGGTSTTRSSAASSPAGGRSQVSSAASGGTSTGGSAPLTMTVATGGTSIATTSSAQKFPDDCPRPEEICEIINTTGAKICRQMTCNDTQYNHCTQSGECVSCPTSPYGGNTHLNCDGDHSNGCEYYVGDKEYATGQQACPVTPS